MPYPKEAVHMAQGLGSIDENEVEVDSDFIQKSWPLSINVVLTSPAFVTYPAGVTLTRVNICHFGRSGDSNGVTRLTHLM